MNLNAGNLRNKLEKFFSSIADLLILNTLFLVFSLPVFTIGASITALNKMMFDKDKVREVKLNKVFRNEFKQNFKQSTAIWMIILFLLIDGFILYNSVLLGYPAVKYSIILLGEEMSNLIEPSIYIIGGKLNRYSLSTYGPRSIEEINNINFNMAFIGTAAYNTDYGFTAGSENEIYIKKAVIKRANKVIMLMDSSKIGKISTYTFAKPKDIDIIISDDKLLDEDKAEFESYNVEVF